MLSFQNFHFCLHLGLFQDALLNTLAQLFMWLSGAKMTVTNTCVTTSIYINICFISIKKPPKFIEQFCTYQSTTVTCPSTWIKVKFTDTNDEFLWKHTELYTKRIEKRITKVITTFKSTHNNNTHVLLVHKITCCFNCTLTHLMHLSSFSPTLLYMPPLLLFCFYEAFQKINKQNNWSSPEDSHGCTSVHLQPREAAQTDPTHKSWPGFLCAVLSPPSTTAAHWVCSPQQHWARAWHQSWAWGRGTELHTLPTEISELIKQSG